MSDMTDSPTGGGDDTALSSHVFIGVITSVGAIILFIAVMMICAFTCLCYNEYRKRRSQMHKHSDRVGLLRSRTEDEDIVSDQETEVAVMGGVKSQHLTSQDEATTPEKRSPPLMAAFTGSNKVCPEPGSSTPPQHKKKHRKRGQRNSEKVSADPPTQDPGSQEEEEKEDVVCTKIDDFEANDEESQATSGEAATYELSTELDDSGDTAQLIHTKEEAQLIHTKEEAQLIHTKEERHAKRESMLVAKVLELEAKAALLGRSVQYAELLSKSCPLDAKAIAALPVGETAVQYKSVPSNSVELPDQTVAQREKNRYRNVLPNPHSAVDLKYTGAEGSTYINANFIRGLHGEADSYIATQGPLFETMSDFWRLVWENDVSIIVMLTNLIENGRHKCVKYWPPANEKNSIVYGNIEVTRVEEEQVPSCYLLSHLSVKNLQTGEERTVSHFWCIAWPDFGIPKVAEHILKLRKEVDSRRTSSPGPVVVHCSAGLGRSGTFIAIDMGIQQYQEAGVVDPMKYLCEMRQDRGGMIQTQDQYTFVHQALAEYIN